MAIRLIKSNLRGSESNDDYFKTLPKVYILYIIKLFVYL
jgi:hypothetical protein